MSRPGIAIRCAGLVTSVGLDTASTCAALRTRQNNFIELAFVDQEHEPLIGAPVPWPGVGTGLDKLAQMAASAIRQALAADNQVALASTPLVLCVAELERAGRLTDLDTGVLSKLEQHFGHPVHADSTVVTAGQTGVATALELAYKLLLDKGHVAVLIVAADTFVNRSTIIHNLDERRLLATGVRAGFIPGEAAGALLVQRTNDERDVELQVFGAGMARELATRDSDAPLRGDGLTQAIERALKTAHAPTDELDLCVCDANGEHYRFEELALAQTRVRIATPLWLPAESLGETGSVVGCIQYAWLLEAQKKHYLPGNNALCLAGNDHGVRTAHIVAFEFSKQYRAAVEASPPMLKKIIKRGGKYGA
jgi:3-oxoacyl-[acyl-carrier-protein] synthase-1